MRTNPRSLLFGAVAISAVSLLVTRIVADDKEVVAARQGTIDLAKLIETGKGADNLVAALRKQRRAVPVIMQAFKPRAENGIGVGSPGPKDGIEVKVVSLGKVLQRPNKLADEKADLVRMGYVAAAIAEVLPGSAPPVARGGKGRKEWEQYAGEMKGAALRLVAAAKRGKPDEVRAASKALHMACNTCHESFR
jgi:hypothetical protein